MTALFGMEHYEVIIVSWLVAATAWVVVSVIGFTVAFLATRPARPARRPAAAPFAAEPARPRGVMADAGTPVGAV